MVLWAQRAGYERGKSDDMSIHQQGRSRRRSVWLSPYLLCGGAIPRSFKRPALSCRTGDTSLSELAVIVDNEDQIVFHPGHREYSVRLTPGAETALVRAFPTDPSAQVWVNVFADSGHYNAMAGAVGGGEATIPLELGMNTLRVHVKASGGATDFYEVGLTRDGRWGDAEHIGGAGAGNSGGARIAADPSGHAVAVWYEFENGGYEGGGPRIWSSGYVPGLGWGVPERIGGAGPEVQSDPSVTMSAHGAAIAVWRQYPPGSLWANRYTSEEGWGVPGPVTEGNTGNTWTLEVASDPIGNALAVWSEYDGTWANIWANRYSVGEGWGVPVLIEGDDAGTALEPRVAVGPNGDAVAVWTQHDGTRYNIWSNRYGVADGWGLAEPIDSGDGGASSPHVGVDHDGRAVAVWGQHDGNWFSAWANRYIPGEGWSVAELIETDSTHGVSYPELAVHPDGDAMAVWTSSSDIWANHYTPSVGWGTAVRIEEGDGLARLPHVALDPQGNAVAVWNQHRFEPLANTVWANHYLRGGGWGVPEIIAGAGARSTYEPRVVVDSNGRALLVWDQSDSDPLLHSTIWSNRFD